MEETPRATESAIRIPVKSKVAIVRLMLAVKLSPDIGSNPPSGSAPLLSMEAVEAMKALEVIWP